MEAGHHRANSSSGPHKDAAGVPLGGPGGARGGRGPSPLGTAQTGGAPKQPCPQGGGGGGGYDVNFLKNVAASLGSNSGPGLPHSASYDVTFLRTVAADLAHCKGSPPMGGKSGVGSHPMPRSSSGNPGAVNSKQYDIKFLKSVAEELPKSSSASSSPSKNYDINFLKNVAAELGTVPAAKLPPTSTVAVAPRGREMLRNLSRDDMFVEVQRGRGWAETQVHSTTDGEDYCEEDFSDDEEEEEDDEMMESSRSYAQEGHVWDYEEEEEEEEENVAGGQVRRVKGDPTEYGESEDTSEGGARQGVALERNYSRDDLDLGLRRPPWESQGQARGVPGGHSAAGFPGGHHLGWAQAQLPHGVSVPNAQHGGGWDYADARALGVGQVQGAGGSHGAPTDAGSGRARKLGRNVSNDDMCIRSAKPTWQGDRPQQPPPPPNRKVLDRNMSKDDMFVPTQRKVFQVEVPSAPPGSGGGPTKPKPKQQVQLDRTKSKCDLSIVVPKPSWEVRGPSTLPPFNPNSAGGPQRKKLDRNMSKDDMDLPARKGPPPGWVPSPRELSGTPRAPGAQAGPGAPRANPTTRAQSKGVKKGGFVHERREVGGGAGVVGLPRDSSRAIPREASRGGMPRNASKAGTPREYDTGGIPRTGSKDGVTRAKGSHAIPRDASGSSGGGRVQGSQMSRDASVPGTPRDGPRVQPKGGPKSKALGRQVSRDDMYVDVLQRQLQQEQMQGRPGGFDPLAGPRPHPGMRPWTPGGPPPGGPKKLERTLSGDSVMEDQLLEEFHRQRLKDKGGVGLPKGSSGGKGGVRRVEAGVTGPVRKVDSKGGAGFKAAQAKAKVAPKASTRGSGPAVVEVRTPRPKTPSLAQGGLPQRARPGTMAS